MSKGKRAMVHYALPHNVVEPAEGTPHHYSGWAPHNHSEAGRQKLVDWKRELFGDDSRYAEPHSEWGGGLMETLLWDLADAGIEFSYAVDQWAGVMTKGKIGDETWTTFVQCDSILLGLMETWRWWFKEKKIDHGGPTL